jgi:AraC-like DNA-binding protein
MRLPKDKLEGGKFPRHRHDGAYATLVISGQYEESGDAGRFCVHAGDVLVHGPYEAHQNVIAACGALVLNIPLPADVTLPRAFNVMDPDELIKAANVDVATVHALLAPKEVIRPQYDDWPDRLAAMLNADPSQSIGQWAADNGLAAETVSRGFRKVFGISSARFRAEARARLALAALRKRDMSLADLAYDLNFADQAHMSRAVRAVANQSPAQWRQVNSVQET